MYSSESRNIAVPKYFKRSARKPKYKSIVLFVIITLSGLGLAAFGFLTFLAGMFSGDPEIFVCIGSIFLLPGGGAFLIGAFFCFSGSNFNRVKRTIYEKECKELEPKPSDQQIDAWHHEDIECIKQNALKKLDLTKDQVIQILDGPMRIVGPHSKAIGKRGLDGVMRFSMHKVVIIYLTKYHLAAYSTVVDLKDGLPSMESTKEYHYVDIVSVSTVTDPDHSQSLKFLIREKGIEKEISNEMLTTEKFTLSVASGEKIEVPIAFPEIYKQYGVPAPTGAENAVKTIRTMLREKKGGAQA